MVQLALLHSKISSDCSLLSPARANDSLNSFSFNFKTNKKQRKSVKIRYCYIRYFCFILVHTYNLEFSIRIHDISSISSFKSLGCKFNFSWLQNKCFESSEYERFLAHVCIYLRQNWIFLYLSRSLWIRQKSDKTPLQLKIFEVYKLDQNKKILVTDFLLDWSKSFSKDSFSFCASFK